MHANNCLVLIPQMSGARLYDLVPRETWQEPKAVAQCMLSALRVETK
jgi:hypothetical protein